MKPPKFDKFQSAAVEITAAFQTKGFETYWVGGAVRDMLLGVEILDIDIATSATPNQTKRILKKLGMRFFIVGEKFGTIGTLVGARKIEITTFRKESGYSDSRHPNRVSFTTEVAEDAGRRDFTINSLYLDPISGELLDFYNGQKDLKEKRLKFVGDPSRRIKEDPLRLLRAVRLAARLNFKLVDGVKIKKYSALIKNTSAERILLELDLIFSDKNYIRAFELLDSTNLLKVLFPEVDNLRKVRQSSNVHAEGSAFVHTAKALASADNYDLDLRYAIFFHDIGKPGTAKKTIRDGRDHISFHGHAQLGAKRFAEISHRLKFPRTRSKKIEYLISHHMDLLHINQFSQETLIKLAQKKYFAELVKLRLADSKGAIMTDTEGHPLKKDYRPWLNLLKLSSRVDAIERRILINGTDVMRILKIKSSPRIGKILQEVRNKQITGKIKTKLDAKKFVKSLDKHSK